MTAFNNLPFSVLTSFFVVVILLISCRRLFCYFHSQFWMLVLSRSCAKFAISILSQAHNVSCVVRILFHQGLFIVLMCIPLFMWYEPQIPFVVSRVCIYTKFGFILKLIFFFPLFFSLTVIEIICSLAILTSAYGILKFTGQLIPT